MLDTVLKKIEEDIYKIIKVMGVDITREFVYCEVPKDKAHGDYSITIAMRLAKILHKNPREIANAILDKMKIEENHIEKAEVAGAGFINIYLDKTYLSKVVFKINKEKCDYAKCNIGNGKRTNIEFVSANPTGYLHIGHCRGAAYGDSLARLLTKTGYDVTREYYINDGGNQIDNLIESMYARYKELYGTEACLSADGYHGVEIITLAKRIKAECGDKYLHEDYHNYFREVGVNSLLDKLKYDLNDFNVHFDVWSSEKTLYDRDIIKEVLNKLIENGYTYKLDNALWLKTTEFGDEKDRVLVKTDGSYTYLTPDIAYHLDKLRRCPDQLIDVLGADHHGYINRIKAAIKFSGEDPEKLDIEICQMVRVLQDGVEIKMSKRSGKAITMRDLLDEVGSDALRFMFVSKALSTPMDLDLDLAIKQSNENPVYYAQYAYTRIRSMFRIYKDFQEVQEFKVINISKMNDIIILLLSYPRVLAEASSKLIPHKICQYVIDLASSFHSYYNDEKIICDDVRETNEKLTVMEAVSYVLKDALSLIGVNTKEKM